MAGYAVVKTCCKPRLLQTVQAVVLKENLPSSEGVKRCHWVALPFHVYFIIYWTTIMLLWNKGGCYM